MAIYYMRTSIIKASRGKSAVASAAYQSGHRLHSAKLDRTFSYDNKEEVVYSEVMLPANAPPEYSDRETLWNAVEEVQNKCNSRYARQFIIAIPNEWSREEAIQRSHEFIKKAFVDRGMAVDWAYHEKNGKSPGEPDNHHVHIMCTVRGFNQDGSWKAMEKKEYALDKNGDRIPEIDPNTGEQKVRERTRNGYHSVEKIWRRITVQSNSWSSRQQLMTWRKEWADFCNQFLAEKDQIDHRSYAERGIDHVPILHEGSAVREMEKRGIHTDISAENDERRELNAFFRDAGHFLQEAWSKLEYFIESIKERRFGYECDGSKATEKPTTQYDSSNTGLSVSSPGYPRRIETGGHNINAIGNENQGSEKDNYEHERDYRRIQGIREKLCRLTERSRTIADALRSATVRKQEPQEYIEQSQQKCSGQQLSKQVEKPSSLRRLRH